MKASNYKSTQKENIKNQSLYSAATWQLQLSPFLEDVSSSHSTTAPPPRRHCTGHRNTEQVTTCKTKELRFHASVAPT